MRISVTGHRPNKLGGYSIQAFNKLDLLFRDWFLHRLPRDLEPPFTIITGMALGWDQAVAQSIVFFKNIGMKINLVAAIPCLNQECKWPESSKTLYKKILDKCDEVVYVSNQPYFPSCMQIRNEWMVDNSELVVALYNGDLSGGTFNCIQYAKKQNKPIINLWSEYESR